MTMNLTLEQWLNLCPYKVVIATPDSYKRSGGDMVSTYYSNEIEVNIPVDQSEKYLRGITIVLEDDHVDT